MSYTIHLIIHVCNKNEKLTKRKLKKKKKNYKERKKKKEKDEKQNQEEKRKIGIPGEGRGGGGGGRKQKKKKIIIILKREKRISWTERIMLAVTFRERRFSPNYPDFVYWNASLDVSPLSFVVSLVPSPLVPFYWLRCWQSAWLYEPALFGVSQHYRFAIETHCSFSLAQSEKEFYESMNERGNVKKKKKKIGRK